MEPWRDFYLAQVGAAGALAGLLMVSVSINVERILANPSLPARALQTLALIGITLVLSSVALFPDLSAAEFGAVAATLGLVMTAVALHDLPFGRDHPDGERLLYSLTQIATLLVASLPMAAGGLLAFFGHGSGPTVIAIAIIIALVGTLQRGWVLMIEILR